MDEEVWLALSTFPDAETAGRVVQQLVSEALAACGNILPGVRSIYRWDGKVEDTAETLVLFKTTASRFPELRARLQALHPYDVPELIALPVTDGLPEYLRWVRENCAPREGAS